MSRLSTLDLALLNFANSQLEAAKFELKCKLLESRVRELEHADAVRIIRDEAHARHNGVTLAENHYRELAARLAKTYAVDLKTSAIEPLTGEITKHEKV